jgi:hypothetical protein
MSAWAVPLRQGALNETRTRPPEASPSLHTVVHEAAHVLQQRAGVRLRGDLGQAGDA